VFISFVKFKDFIAELDPPVVYYIKYALRRRGIDLDKDELALDALADAVGPHVAEVLYTLYIEASRGRRKLTLLAT